MKVKRTVLFSLLALSLVLSACGGQSGPDTSIKVTFSDFKFTPTDFTIAAGQPITITATNEGQVEHEFVIMKLGMTAGEKFGDEDEANIYWEVEALPGETKTETFTAPTEPGVYELICGTQGHLEAGMVGKLTVAQ
jgi:uncharacterized cupredoxin-like copper-binding protein